MGNYSIPVCAISSRSDRYVWNVGGTEEDVVSQMASEQECSEESIRDKYEIDESSIDIPDEIINCIIADALEHTNGRG